MGALLFFGAGRRLALQIDSSDSDVAVDTER
jgi:hypothetical protein